MNFKNTLKTFEKEGRKQGHFFGFPFGKIDELKQLANFLKRFV